MNQNTDTDDDERVGFFATVGSVLSAFFGVQSSKNRERDFQRGSPSLFFVIAIAMTGMFALILLTVVRLIASTAGAGR